MSEIRKEGQYKTYHDRYESLTEKYSWIYAKFYKFIYNSAISLAYNLKKEPLKEHEPKVLLCGTATSETARNFVEFIQGKNKESKITILDLNFQPLERSQAKLAKTRNIDSKKIDFIQGDALKLPIPGNSIDLIETDFFLQFFSNEDKVTLIKEWARILSTNGVITTREFLPNGPISRYINNFRIWMFHRLGIESYESNTEDLIKIFKDIGLEVKFVPFKFGPLHSHWLNNIIAYKSISS